MNPNVVGRMSNGCAYKSQLGMNGIAAVNGGEAGFNRFADELEVSWNDRFQRVFAAATETLPNQGYLIGTEYALLFSMGASNISLGNQVLQGLVDADHFRDTYGFNRRFYQAMDARWSSYIAAFRGRITDAFLFGHSAGGPCVEAAAANWARQYTSTHFWTETYGAARSCVTTGFSPPTNFVSMRNVIDEDVVSHIPYHSEEAPLAAAVTPASVRASFDRSAHSCSARVFRYDGNWSPMANNAIGVQDITLTILSWMAYAQHLTSRPHELATYVATMNAYALRDPRGTLPPADMTTIPAPIQSPTPLSPGVVVVGEAPTPQSVSEALAELEEAAAAEFFHSPVQKPARGVVRGEVAGVEFRGGVVVRASDRRSAKGIAKRLNKIRRLLGPLTTEQRAEVIEQVVASLEGV